MKSIPCFVLATLASLATAQDPPHPIPTNPPRTGIVDRVTHDAADGVTPWAVGADWKASFGRDGFTFVPFFGATAPRNFPVRFELVEVRVGAGALPFARDVAALRTGDRYEYTRGPVFERYDLSLSHVEQTIVVDTAEAGDIDVVFGIASELAEDPTQHGVQFRNGWGQVDYGQAFLVRGAERIALPTHCVDGQLRLHVPAALRGDGPVVIDPLVTTHATGIPLSHPSQFPDVAWDEGRQVWLTVFQHAYSATDMDMRTELYDSAGVPIPGSSRFVDASTANAYNGRVANSRGPGVFAVVYELSDPAVASGRAQIHGMVFPAIVTGTPSQRVLLSNPANGHTAVSPDVGGDPAIANGSPFQVAWLEAGGEVWTRRINASGVALGTGPVRLVQHGATFANLRISKANGRGRVNQPGWLLTWAHSLQGAFVIDALLIDAGGAAGAPLTLTSGDDRYPEVTEPFAGPNGQLRFAISYERQLPAQARAVVYEPTTQVVVTNQNLTTVGIGPFWLRMRSDGVRFACTSSPDGARIELATLAYDQANDTWIRQDGPYALPGAPHAPAMATRASAGGAVAECACVYVDTSVFGGRNKLTLYRAHAPGTVFGFAGTGCNGLSIGFTDYPLLGTTIGFPVSGHGTDLACVAFGEPLANPVALCGSCQIGLRLDMPMQFFVTDQLNVSIPDRPALVGSTFGVQSFALGSGPCLSGLTLGDTLWVTIR